MGEVSMSESERGSAGPGEGRGAATTAGTTDSALSRKTEALPVPVPNRNAVGVVAAGGVYGGSDRWGAPSWWSSASASPSSSLGAGAQHLSPWGGRERLSWLLSPVTGEERQEGYVAGGGGFGGMEEVRGAARPMRAAPWAAHLGNAAGSAPSAGRWLPTERSMAPMGAPYWSAAGTSMPSGRQMPAPHIHMPTAYPRPLANTAHSAPPVPPPPPPMPHHQPPMPWTAGGEYGASTGATSVRAVSAASTPNSASAAVIGASSRLWDRHGACLPEMPSLVHFYDHDGECIRRAGNCLANGQIESLEAPAVDDEHVTVWNPDNGKTVAGNAAPYRRNLNIWLEKNPGWVEKFDSEKSTKRQSAARRSKAAANAFALLCTTNGRIREILKEVDRAYERAMGDAVGEEMPWEAAGLRTGGSGAVSESPTATAPSLRGPDGRAAIAAACLREWTSDEVVRLQELLVRYADELAQAGGALGSDDGDDDDDDDIMEDGSQDAADAPDTVEEGAVFPLPPQEQTAAGMSERGRSHSETAAPSEALPLSDSIQQSPLGALVTAMDLDVGSPLPTPASRRSARRALPPADESPDLSGWHSILETLRNKPPRSIIIRSRALFGRTLAAAAQLGSHRPMPPGGTPTAAPDSSGDVTPPSASALAREWVDWRAAPPPLSSHAAPPISTQPPHAPTVSSSSSSMAPSRRQSPSSADHHLSGVAALHLGSHSLSSSPTADTWSLQTTAAGSVSASLREERVTVWEPATGRTVSGNAAPCRRNAEQWLRDHPGWCVKHEDELSAARRLRYHRLREQQQQQVAGYRPPQSRPYAMPEAARPDAATLWRSAPDHNNTFLYASPVSHPHGMPVAASPAESVCIEGLLLMRHGSSGNSDGATTPTAATPTVHASASAAAAAAKRPPRPPTASHSEATTPR